MLSTVNNNNNNTEDEFVEEEILNQQSHENHNNGQLRSFINQYGIVRPRISKINSIKNHWNRFYNTISCICIINSLLDRIPIIRCFKEYNLRKNLFYDVNAGFTIAIMHIPQGMAYGILTTLPPVHGLYVSFFPVLLYMIFGTCPHLSMVSNDCNGTPSIACAVINDITANVPLQKKRTNQ
ncbi:unnamed protein product [Adineta steineri]|uniref:SLC26A/SulP transporter domain-containing protein n=1 Tax=Adineta steineri TaxID=433720 RepID=A0A820AKC9_9BILA|nr:unnamed protein product [Adineta steineri]